jgi:hypothetical protein
LKGSINQKVVAWAHGKLKKRVGRGQCWDLADQALRHAGAHSSTTVGPDDDYEWGTEIPINTVVPGDILQFRDHVVMTTTSTRTTWANGSISSKPESIPANRPHHTAIVVAVAPGVLKIYEQHVKPDGDHVQLHTLPIRAGTTVTTEHKVLKTTTGGQVAGTVVTTVTISISGRVWAYRPIPASAGH